MTLLSKMTAFLLQNEAEQQFRKAIELNPAHNNAKHNLQVCSACSITGSANGTLMLHRRLLQQKDNAVESSDTLIGKMRTSMQCRDDRHMFFFV